MNRIKDTARDWDFATSPLTNVPPPSDPIWQTPKMQRLLALLRGERRAEPDTRVEQDAA